MPIPDMQKELLELQVVLLVEMNNWKYAFKLQVGKIK